MPYIKKELRVDIDKALSKVEAVCGALDYLEFGELNYLITKMLLMTKPECYDDYNSLIGVLECIKQEFYRRAVALYEDEKKEENGDVY